jgi:hypothetical protein
LMASDCVVADVRELVLLVGTTNKASKHLQQSL